MLQKMRIKRIQKKMAITPVPIKITISTLVLSSEPMGQAYMGRISSNSFITRN